MCEVCATLGVLMGQLGGSVDKVSPEAHGQAS